MVYDWKLLLLLFKSGIEINPGPNDSIDSNLLKKADERKTEEKGWSKKKCWKRWTEWKFWEGFNR